MRLWCYGFRLRVVGLNTYSRIYHLILECLESEAELGAFRSCGSRYGLPR